MHTALLHQITTAHQLPQLAGIDAVGGRGREGHGRGRGHEGVAGQRIGAVRRPGPARGHLHPGQIGGHRPLQLVQRGQVQAQRAGGGHGCGQPGPDGLQVLGVHRPFPDVGLSPDAGQPLQAVDGDAAPLGHHPLHRPVGPGPGGGQDGIDVQHHAAAHRL